MRHVDGKLLCSWTSLQQMGALMKLRHILSVGALIAAVILFLVNLPAGAFGALLVGTAIELAGAALTGKKTNN